MKELTTFHLSDNKFTAIIDRCQRDIVVALRNDTEVGDVVRLCSDDLKQAVQATVNLVDRTNIKHDMMAIVIKDVLVIDYDICD